MCCSDFDLASVQSVMALIVVTEDLLKPGEKLLVEESVRQHLPRCCSQVICCSNVKQACCPVQVDPTIMGGMVVDIGDKHIDMSISARVKKIQQLVMQTV